MDVTQVLKQALAAVNAAELPEDLRGIGFTRAIDLLAAPTAPAQVKPAPRRSNEDASDGNGAGGSDTAGDSTAAIARALDIEPDLVERLFDEHDGAVRFVGNADPLGKTKAQKVADIIVLLVAARSAAGYDATVTPDQVGDVTPILGHADPGSCWGKRDDLEHGPQELHR